MRIAAVVNRFPQITEGWIRLQLLELERRGEEVSLFALSRGNGDAKPFTPRYVGHRWSAVPSRLSTDFDGRRTRDALVRAIKHRSLGTFARDAAALLLPHRLPADLSTPKYDLVHCHFGHVGREVAIALGNRHVPLVVSFYGFDAFRLPTSWGGDMFHSLFRRAAAINSLGPHMDERLIALGCPLHLLRRVPVGVDTDFFPFLSAHRADDGPIRLLSVARLVDKKGLSVGLEAAALLARRTGRLVQYHIAGDGPLRSRLERQASRLGNRVAVRFLGSISPGRSRQELAECDVCVVPSLTAPNGDSEGTPVAAMEAMAMGRPVVASTNGDLAFLLGDGSRGTLVSEGDCEALARGIEDCLSQEITSQLRRAREYVVEFHSPLVVGDCLTAIYRNTLS